MRDGFKGIPKLLDKVRSTYIIGRAIEAHGRILEGIIKYRM